MKLKNITLFFILLLYTIAGYATAHTVYGTINGSDGKPVAFCLVKATGSSQFTYSDDHGKFSITSDAGLPDSLVFVCVGYETKEIKAVNDTFSVTLTRKVTALTDVQISSTKREGKVKHGLIGKTSLKAEAIVTGFIGTENALFLQANRERHGELEQVFFYITKGGIPNSRFRVHVYSIDTGYLPGNELLDSNVILYANEGDEWVSVDLSSAHISLNSSVFVSMEWISGYGNSERLVTDSKYTAQPAFNGQVLGFTPGYWKQGSLFYSRRNVNSPWIYRLCRGTSKKNVMNPMIYATYTYFK